jgi:hypothetical protein
VLNGVAGFADAILPEIPRPTGFALRWKPARIRLFGDFAKIVPKAKSLVQGQILGL